MNKNKQYLLILLLAVFVVHAKAPAQSEREEPIDWQQIVAHVRCKNKQQKKAAQQQSKGWWRNINASCHTAYKKVSAFVDEAIDKDEPRSRSRELSFLIIGGALGVFALKVMGSNAA